MANLNPKSNFVFLVYAFVALALVNAVVLSTPATAETFTDLRAALYEVAAKYQIRVGLECAPQEKDPELITLDLSEKNVDTVLNQLVKQKTNYVWAFVDNVYDIYPKSNPDSILDVRIHEFSMEGLSSEEAADLVGEIPEIKEWLTSRSVSRHEFLVCAGSCRQSSEKLVTVSLKDVTFRTLLNTLIREFGVLDWMVCRYGDNQEYIAIYLD